MKYFSTFLIMLLSTQLFSKNWEALSAHRFKSESFESAFLERSRLDRAFLSPGSAYNTASPYEHLDFSRVPKWTDQELRYAYSRIRDERFMPSSAGTPFPRRSTWLYPQDGCWARAALSAKRSGEWGLKRPSKVFVFGDLEVKTPNAKEGEVTWWYHVVPLVKDENGVPVVLDPSIESGKPLPLTDWLSKMGVISKMQIAICNTYTYGPMDSCELSTQQTEADATTDQLKYLPYEWKNLEELNRNPTEELGEHPPWNPKP